MKFLMTKNCSRDIYSGHPPPPGGGEVLVQIEKTGKNLKEAFMKKGRGKKKKEKSNKTHVIITL